MKVLLGTVESEGLARVKVLLGTVESEGLAWDSGE